MDGDWQAAAFRTASAIAPPGVRRVWAWLLLASLVAAAVLAGLLWTGAAQEAAAVAAAGQPLTRLLRAMAAMKALAACALTAAVLWRLRAPVGGMRLAAYALACAAMAAGPGLIWGMAHVRLGALLLHGGLLATVLLLWRDPATGALLSTAVSRRREILRKREGLLF